ncbi:hypothetical protein [Cronobacter phage EspYZU13]|uniref:Uncharacterized protein n=1 Tax=Cronobacter phage EspYZU13 TaxID=3003790 RepID=A0AAF0AQT4_9CAUD|nr:hypothetical protein [Cronobacter phage EspYZU13]
MSTGTSLVHPDTAKLTPDEQKKGIYEYTPPEVIAYLRGERLSATDLELVTNFYGGTLPNLTAAAAHAEPALAERKTTKPPAMAAPYGRKLVAKRKVQPGGTPLVDITKMMAANLPDDDAWAVLVTLAQRFDLEVE